MQPKLKDPDQLWLDVLNNNYKNKELNLVPLNSEIKEYETPYYSRKSKGLNWSGVGLTLLCLAVYALLAWIVID